MTKNENLSKANKTTVTVNIEQHKTNKNQVGKFQIVWKGKQTLLHIVVPIGLNMQVLTWWW